MMFRTVPSWVSYRRIPQCRYRQVLVIRDPGDEIDGIRSGVKFLGYPGGAGWARNIGSVAIHYLRRGDWAIFSKNLPFPDQSKTEQEVLLLGAATDVFITPVTLYMAPKGLREEAAPVKLLTSEGITKNIKLSAVPPFERLRLFLTWGDENDPHATQVNHLRPSPEVLSRKRGVLMRAMRRIKRAVQWLNQRIKVDEHFDLYPTEPVQPEYYGKILNIIAQRADAASATKTNAGTSPAKAGKATAAPATMTPEEMRPPMPAATKTPQAHTAHAPRAEAVKTPTVGAAAVPTAGSRNNAAADVNAAREGFAQRRSGGSGIWARSANNLMAAMALSGAPPSSSASPPAMAAEWIQAEDTGARRRSSALNRISGFEDDGLSDMAARLSGADADDLGTSFGRSLDPRGIAPVWAGVRRPTLGDELREY